MTKLTGAWIGWTITDGLLISPSGRQYKPEDIEPIAYTQAELAKALGVSRAAITGRINRGTLPPFDDKSKKTWDLKTIKPFLKRS